jgi:hypothetical protein
MAPRRGSPHNCAVADPIAPEEPMSRTGSSRRRARATGLEQAASTIFVLTALLPLLIFAWTIYVLEAMHDLHAQLGLGLALLVSMLGFVILRTTMRRTSDVLRLLVRAHEQTPAPPAADLPAAGEAGAATGPGMPAAPAASATAKAASSVDIAPAIGAIQELRDATDAIVRRWRREAEGLAGRLVVVQVANLDQPEIGILRRLSEVGIVLEHDGQEFGVMWRLITSLQLDPGVPASPPTDAVAPPGPRP